MIRSSLPSNPPSLLRSTSSPTLHPQRGPTPRFPRSRPVHAIDPPVTTTWQSQLQGDVNTGYDVALYELDLVETPTSVVSALKASGRRVLCYFSAGSWEDFRPDVGKFPESVLGSVYSGFEDERWLDVRAPEVMTPVTARLDLSVQRGCDEGEADNVDGFENENATGFPLTATDQLAYDRGLAVAMKDDVGQVADLLEYVDLHVSERCHEFDEYSLLEPFITQGKPVLNAEYLQQYVTDALARVAVCTSALGRGLHTLILPEDLDDPFRFSFEPA